MQENSRPLAQWLHKFFHAIIHNWPYKLIAVLVALGLWAGLISQDPTLTREKFFSDVPVSVSGSENLRRNNGLIVVSGLEERLDVRMRADVPQSAYATVAASNYNPRIDLTRINEPGLQSLKILTTSSSIYGTVSSLSPDSVEVEVERYVTNYRVPVTVNLTGSYAEGISGTTPVPDVNTVAVSGPQSVVDRISRLCVDYDPAQSAGKTGLVRMALPFRFEDADGQPVESSLIEVTSAEIILRSIAISQTLYQVKEVAVSVPSLTSGAPAAGYEVASVTVFPETVLVGGSEEALSSLEALFAESPIDLSGRSETFTQALKLRKPADLNSPPPDTVTVTVEIKPILVSRTFQDIRVTSLGLPSSLKVGSILKTVHLTVTGPMNLVKSLKSSQFSVSVDLSSLTEAGQYSLPFLVSANGADPSSFSSITVLPEECSVSVIAK